MDKNAEILVNLNKKLTQNNGEKKDFSNLFYPFNSTIPSIVQSLCVCIIQDFTVKFFACRK